MPVVPGGLDQEAAGVAVAGLGHVPARRSVAGGVLGDGQAEEAHQLAGRPKRRKSPISASSPSAVSVEMPRKQHSQRDRVAPGMAARDLLELAVDRRELRVERVEVAEHVLERGLGERVVEALAPDPGRCWSVQAFFPSRKIRP